MLQALHCRFLGKPMLWGWSSQRKWEGGWGLVLMLCSPDGWQGPEGACLKEESRDARRCFISQD